MVSAEREKRTETLLIDESDILYHMSYGSDTPTYSLETTRSADNKTLQHS